MHGLSCRSAARDGGAALGDAACVWFGGRASELGEPCGATAALGLVIECAGGLLCHTEPGDGAGRGTCSSGAARRAARRDEACGGYLGTPCEKGLRCVFADALRHVPDARGRCAPDAD